MRLTDGTAVNAGEVNRSQSLVIGTNMARAKIAQVKAIEFGPEIPGVIIDIATYSRNQFFTLGGSEKFSMSNFSCSKDFVCPDQAQTSAWGRDRATCKIFNFFMG